jgi:uncharacterized protein (DUF58 family)
MAEALAFLLLQQTDAVGLATVTGRVQHFLRPSARGGNHFREFLKLLATPPASPAPSHDSTPAHLGPTLDELATRLGRRGIVFLFSDLLDDVQPFLDGLRHLQFQKHEVVVFHVLDAAELDFPFRHPTLFRGLEGWPELSTDPLAIRESYLEELNRHLTAIEDGCRRLEIDLVRVRTDANLGHELAVYLQKRIGQ